MEKVKDFERFCESLGGIVEDGDEVFVCVLPEPVEFEVEAEDGSLKVTGEFSVNLTVLRDSFELKKGAVDCKGAEVEEVSFDRHRGKLEGSCIARGRVVKYSPEKEKIEISY